MKVVPKECDTTIDGVGFVDKSRTEQYTLFVASKRSFKDVQT